MRTSSDEAAVRDDQGISFADARIRAMVSGMVASEISSAKV